MEEESEQFCSNCKRNVGAANFASHSAYCHRFITICKECKEPVKKDLIEEHEAESHVILKCDWCTISLKKWMLSQHQERCPRRPTICEFCDADVPFDESEKHIKFCGSRTEKCSLCFKYIMLKDKQKHSEEMCSKRRVICEFCKDDFSFDKYEDHIKPCGDYPEKCSVCSHYFRRRNRKEHFESHEEMIPKASYGDREIDQNSLNEMISNKTKNFQGVKSSDKIPVLSEKNNDDFGSIIGAAAHVSEKSKQVSCDFTVCHSCRQPILWEDYENHVKACMVMSMTDLRKCPNCNESISSFAEHNVSCQASKNLKSQYDTFESMTEQKRSLYPDFDEFAMKRRPIKKPCSMCNQLFSTDELSEHLKSCPANYMECELCNEPVLRKDWDSHFSLKCKMLQERVLCDSYECPLCGETLPENEKTIHESFKCKVLLDMHDEPLYSEEKFAKRPKETAQKNSTEVCLQCKNTIPKHKMASHKKSCHKNVSTVCAYCEKEVSVGLEEYHLQYRCEVFPQIKKINEFERVNDLKRVNDLERVNDHKGAKPKYSKISEMAMPKVGQCMYCKTTLNDNILMFHQTECIHQPIKCPECSKNMLLKDFDNHKCKLPKGKGDKRNQKPDKPEPQGFFSTIFCRKPNYNAKTLDQCQNDRNQYIETHMENRFTPLQQRNDDDLYFGTQPFIDDTKLPCEFCEKLFPASEIVLHMTGCNQEVSLPKQSSSEKSKENYGNLAHPKQPYDHMDTSNNFFSVNESNFIPTTRYESIHRRLEQKSEAKPGEYLSSCYEAASKSENSHHNSLVNRKENLSSSKYAAVWNNDSSDVEMEESDPETNTKVQKDQEKVKRKISFDEIKHQSNESDEEMSCVWESIEETVKQSESHRRKDLFTSKSEVKTEVHEHSSKHSNNAAGTDNSDKATARKCMPEFHKASNFSVKKEQNFEDVSEEANETYALKLNTDLSTSKSDVKTEPYEHSRKHSTNAADIDYSHERVMRKYKPDYHKVGDFSINKEKSFEGASEEASKMYSSKLNTDVSPPERDSNPDIGSKQYHHSTKLAEKSVLDQSDRKNYLSSIISKSYEMRISSDEKDKNHEEVSKAASKAYLSNLDSAYNSTTTTDKNFKEQYRNALSYILNTEENATQDSVTKKTIVNTNSVHRKLKISDSDDDELDHLSEADKSQYKKYVYKTESDCTQEKCVDEKKNQHAEAKSALDKVKKSELSNFRFCSNRMNSSCETEKLQNSKVQEYDLYYKTNALGFVAADEESVIRKLKKRDDTVCQSSRYLTKSKDESPDISSTNQKEKAESITQGGSSVLYERAKQILKPKDKCLNDNNIETSQNERNESRTRDIPEKAIEVVRSKYEYQSDRTSEADQRQKAESRGQDFTFTSSLSEKSLQMSRSKPKHEIDKLVHKSHEETFESKTCDVSAPTHEKSAEKSKYFTVCPICRETIKWIDYNLHLPSCAANSGKCSCCGEIVPSSELKEHIFSKCSRTLLKGPKGNQSPEKIRSERCSYESILKSLTSYESANERKSKEFSESARMKAHKNEEKMHYTESSELSRTNQAFRIEPADNYWHPSRLNVQGDTHNYAESSTENKPKKDDESSKSYSSNVEDDVETWKKWRNKATHDDSQ